MINLTQDASSYVRYRRYVGRYPSRRRKYDQLPLLPYLLPPSTSATTAKKYNYDGSKIGQRNAIAYTRILPRVDGSENNGMVWTWMEFIVRTV